MGNAFIKESTLTDIANAIRTKTGGSEAMLPSEMTGAIEGIKTGFPNGTEWTRSNVTSGAFNKICKLKNIWVAASFDTTGLWYSTNGKTWTQSNITIGKFDDVLYIKGLWQAYGENGLYYSTNGKTWTLSNIAISGVKAMLYENSVWNVAVNNSSGGGVYYSTDGKTWTQSNVTGTKGKELHCEGGIRIATAHGLWYSTDGKTWTKPSTFSSDDDYLHVIRAKNLWIVFSDNAAIGLYYSTDGKTWTQSNITNVKFDWSLETNDVIILKTYVNGIYYSADGKTWAQSLTVSTNKALYENGLYVATTPTGIYYSTDGKTWTQSNNTSDSFSGILYYANGLWQASGATGLWYSTDGKAWMQSNITIGGSMANVSSIGYTNGLWIACIEGYRGVYYSTDGKTWTQSNITGGVDGTGTGYAYNYVNINGIWVAYANEIFFDSGDGIWYSVTWEPDPPLIGFWIDTDFYHAEEGMTWAEWVDSVYNTGVMDYGNLCKWKVATVSYDNSTCISRTNYQKYPDGTINTYKDLSIQSSKGDVKSEEVIIINTTYTSAFAPYE